MIKYFSARLFGGFALGKFSNDKKIVLLGKLSQFGKLGFYAQNLPFLVLA